MILEEFNHQNITYPGCTGMAPIGKGTDYRLNLNTNGGEMEADMILIAVGIRPDVKLANDLGLQIEKRGAIQVDFPSLHRKKEYTLWVTAAKFIIM